MVPGTDIKAEVAALLASKDAVGLKKRLENWQPADLAPLLADLPFAHLTALFRACSRDFAAATFAYLPPDDQRRLLKSLNQEQVAALLDAMSPDDRTAFLDELPLEVAMQLLGMMSPAERQVARDLLAYPPHSVGRLMTLDYVAIHPEWTVGQALEYIRTHGVDRETLNIIFVVDDNGHLIDDVRVRQLLLSSHDQPVRQLLDGNFAMLSPVDDREKALALFKQLDRVALPVTDGDRKLIGIVTVDDMLDVSEEEATEDIQKLGGTEALDEPYISISLAKMVKKRASWLVILFVSEMLTTTAMTSFQAELDKATVLSLFLPLILSSGGNSGSQGSTLVIRALALGEFKLREWWKVMRREIIAGVSLGAVLGAIGYLRIAIWSAYYALRHEVNPYGGSHWPLIALTVSISVVGTVLWGSLMGTMLPLVIKKVGFDPATSSAPFVATLVDVTGVIIYFSVAYVVLRGTLL